jgi:hypothetical protein
MPRSAPWVAGLRVRTYEDRVELWPSPWPEMRPFRTWFGGFAGGILIFGVLALFAASPRLGLSISPLRVLWATEGAFFLLVVAFVARVIGIAVRQRRAGPLVVRHRPRGRFDFPRWRLSLEPDALEAFEIIQADVLQGSVRNAKRGAPASIEQLTAVYADPRGRLIRRFLAATEPHFKREVITWLETLFVTHVYTSQLDGRMHLIKDLLRDEPPGSIVFADHALAAADPQGLGDLLGTSATPLSCPKCGYPVDDLPDARVCPECGVDLLRPSAARK